MNQVSYRPSRRSLLRGLATLPLAPGLLAQTTSDYPRRPIKLVVAVSPGGATDSLARVVSVPLGAVLKQPVLIDNKPGGYSIVGADFVAKSPADGYTLLLGGTGPLVANQATFASLPYDSLRDFAAVSILGTLGLVLVTRQGLGVSSVAQLIELAKQKPGGLSYGSSSASFQIAAETFSRKAGIKLLHVPYRGNAPVLQAVASGEVDLSFLDPSAVLGLIKSDKIRVIALSAHPRPPGFEGIPLVSESGLPDYHFDFFLGLAAPAATPAAVVNKISAAVTQVMTEPAVREQIQRLGILPVGSTPAQASERVRRDIREYTELAKAHGIKSE